MHKNTPTVGKVLSPVIMLEIMKTGRPSKCSLTKAVFMELLPFENE